MPDGQVSTKRGQTANALPGFMTFSAMWVQVLFKPVGYLYMTLHDFMLRGGRIVNWLIRDHFLFFALAIMGTVFLVPRYFVIAEYFVEKYVLNLAVPRVDTSGFPYIPNLLIPLFILFFITYFLSPRYRLTILLILALPLAILAEGSFDVPSAVVYLIFLAAVFLVIKLPIRRVVKLIFICSAAVLLLYLSRNWPFLAGMSIGGIAAFQAALIPMLWYSVYEELPPKRTMNPWKFLLYHYARIFGSPVLTYKDAFSPVDSLSKVRFEGIKAIYVALLASLLGWAIANITDPIDEASLQGLPLLAYSYGQYVVRYCRIWVMFNLFIGCARLFGIPVRDNFNYWLLARTPNEHWRRWNILLREWVITFIFFPIMRAKKWVFIAIMASLMVSGILHLIPRFFDQEIPWFPIGSSLSYWFLNGLAIYAVVKFPTLFPGTMQKLKIRSSKVWSVIGILLTSAFYGILHQGASYRNLTEVGNYLARLFTF
ncbi:MAG: hypothetical protein FJ110_13570 [Deltaproteobacteria bacterium]|nr:hypothetical protein [Deltaproteobacteria bacterium]